MNVIANVIFGIRLKEEEFEGLSDSNKEALNRCVKDHFTELVQLRDDSYVYGLALSCLDARNPFIFTINEGDYDIYEPKFLEILEALAIPELFDNKTTGFHITTTYNDYP